VDRWAIGGGNRCGRDLGREQNAINHGRDDGTELRGDDSVENCHVSVMFSHPTTSPWETRSKPQTKHGRGDRPERRPFEIKWHPSQPVQRVAELTPEPIADNSILRGMFFIIVEEWQNSKSNSR
jgi:hypothetical protein